MSMHNSTIRTDAETLVYFAKYFQSELASVDFQLVYSVPADTSRLRFGNFPVPYINSTDPEYIVRYEPALYGMRFYDVELW